MVILSYFLWISVTGLVTLAERSPRTITPVWSTTPVVTPIPLATTTSQHNGTTETNLTISPDICTEVVDRNVNFSCHVDHRDNKYKEVLVVNIVRDNYGQIAAMRTGSKISFRNDELANRYKADGHIGNATYLNLILTSPKPEDSGNYTCIISYINEYGYVQQERKSSKLSVNSLDLEHKESLKTAVMSLIQRLENVESVNEQQLHEINELETKSRKRSSFSAMLSTKRNFRRPLGPNMLIIFDAVIMKQGPGYDEKRGVFTAPFLGLYDFHLTMGTWSKRSTTYTEVTLQVNGVPKSILRTNNDRHLSEGYQDQNSMSFLIVLKPGDTVKIVTVAGTTRLEEVYGYMSTFSGYLVRAY